MCGGGAGGVGSAPSPGTLTHRMCPHPTILNVVPLNPCTCAQYGAFAAPRVGSLGGSDGHPEVAVFLLCRRDMGGGVFEGPL